MVCFDKSKTYRMVWSLFVASMLMIWHLVLLFMTLAVLFMKVRMCLLSYLLLFVVTLLFLNYSHPLYYTIPAHLHISGHLSLRLLSIAEFQSLSSLGCKHLYEHFDSRLLLITHFWVGCDVDYGIFPQSGLLTFGRFVLHPRLSACLHSYFSVHGLIFIYWNLYTRVMHVELNIWLENPVIFYFIGLVSSHPTIKL